MMDRSDQTLQDTIPPLRLIFWGGLLSVVDYTVASDRWRVDVLSDLLGLLMITWAVYRLGGLQAQRSYRIAMRFVLFAAILACFKAAHDHVIYKAPAAMQVAVSVIGVLAMMATVVFCLCMRWLCRVAGLERAQRSWTVTAVLFVCVYAIPHGLFCLVAATTAAAGTPIDIDLGRGMILVVLLFAIPLVHLFVSTSRMRRDAQLQTGTHP